MTAPRYPALPIAVREGTLILVTALFLSVLAWLFSPPPPVVPGSSAPFDEIDQGTLKLILAQDEHLLLDARPADSFQSGHLPGALNLPAYDFEAVFPTLSDRFNPSLTVIVYCSSASCQDADLLAQSLHARGVTNILLYRGGFADWAETGNTLATGDHP